MGRHKDPDTLAVMQWLMELGEELNFVTAEEYVIKAGEFFADVVWMLGEGDDPIITFEIETSDNVRVFSNTMKWFGTPSDYVTKPWRHYMVIAKGELTSGHRAALTNLINQHNISIFEDVHNDLQKKGDLETELRSKAQDIPALLARYVESKPVGETLPRIIESIEKAFKEMPISKPEVKITVTSGSKQGEGIPFNMKFETKPGEPLIIERMREAVIENKPLTITEEEIKSLKMEGKEFLPPDMKEAKLVFTPIPNIIPLRLEVRGTELFIDGLKFRKVREDEMSMTLSTEERNLPLIFVMDVEKTTKKMKFSYHLYEEAEKIGEALHYQEVLAVLEEKKSVSFFHSETGVKLISFNS